MKTQITETRPVQPTVRRILCRGLILILAALVLQGCATAKLGGARAVDPLAQPAVVLGREAGQKESGQMLSLWVWRF